MPKRKSASKKITPEEVLHIAIHIFGILFLYWAMIFLPVWLSFVVLVAEYLQVKLLGNCFLTIFAHKRGLMKGKNFWSHVFYRMGVKKYAQADEKISLFIKITLVAIPVLRLIQSFLV